jgi:hypothetical protein
MTYVNIRNGPMRYLVKARVKPGREEDLLHAIRDQSLGQGSIAGDEYLDDMVAQTPGHRGRRQTRCTTDLIAAVGNGAFRFSLIEHIVHMNTSCVSLDPQELQDLLDELQRSRQSRKRAWENLQEIRWVLKDAAGVDLAPPARKTIDLEGRIVKDGVRLGSTIARARDSSKHNCTHCVACRHMCFTLLLSSTIDCSQRLIQ